MTENIGSGTARGLIDYLDSLVDKGRSRAGVVTPLKTALVKVLEKTEGDDWEKVDVTKLDVTDAITRFKNLTLGVYTDASYRAYELRTQRAIKWYENFLASPGWFPKEGTRMTKADGDNGKHLKGRKSGGKQNSLSTDDLKGKHTTEPIASSSTDIPKIDAIAYPFPLANGETARVYMPNGVTKADVKRLSSFLEALVIDNESEQTVERLPTRELISKYRAEYKKLRPTYSKAIGDKVYFNMPGFKHLIFKGNHRRETADIFNRLVLIPLIAPVIHNCDEEKEIRIRNETVDGKKARVTYYALEAHVGKESVRVRVITRKVGEKGKHYFQSIMKY